MRARWEGLGGGATTGRRLLAKFLCCSFGFVVRLANIVLVQDVSLVFRLCFSWEGRGGEGRGGEKQSEP